MKKIAVIAYPHFSLYEVTCLTEALMWFESSVEIFASSREPVRSEDGFLITPDKTLDEFSAGDYACVVIDFLASLKGKELLIAAISAGPMLLAKAGLLEDVHFTSGIWEEICQNLDFIPHQNILHRPLVKEKNIITAVGFAFREFAEEVIRTLGIDPCEPGLFRGIYKEFTEQEMTHFMGEENFQHFLQKYQQWQQRQ